MGLFRISIVAGAVVLGACSGPDSGSGSASVPASSGSGATASSDAWQVLFDGSDLSRWNVVGDANWEIVDGAVRADSSTGNSFLVSDVDYGDFDLSVEFFVSVDANSGVFLRCRDPEVIGAESCYEVNIYDTRPDQTYRTGSVVDYAEPAAFVYTGGRWNTFEISAHGPRIQVTLNGVMMVDMEDSTYSRGPIALQYGAGTVMFRSVRVRTP